MIFIMEFIPCDVANTSIMKYLFSQFHKINNSGSIGGNPVPAL